MKSPLHNVNRPDGRPDKSGPMLFQGYGPRILSVSVLSLSLVAGPLRLRSRPGGRHIAERSELCPRRQQLNPCRMAHPGAGHVAGGPGRNRWQRNRQFRLARARSLVSGRRPFRVRSMRWKLAIPAFCSGCSKRRRAYRCGIGAAFNSQSFRRGTKWARRGPQRRWGMDIVTSTRSGTYIFRGKRAD
jgi:hypothetical protein